MEHYKQTTDSTSAAASLMLIINHFNNKFPINKENEFKIWQKTAALPAKGSSIFALALLAKKNGLRVKAIVGDKEYRFSNHRLKKYTKKEIYEAKFTSNLFYEEAIKEGVDIEEREFDFNEVKEMIKQKKVIMLRVNSGDLFNTYDITQYLLIHGYGNNIFLYNDTINGKTTQLKEYLLKQAFENVKRKCRRDYRMIVFG